MNTDSDVRDNGRSIIENPKVLIVEASTRCNLGCVMCVRNGWREEMGDMTMPMYRSLLSVFPELNLLILNGYGEPLLNENLIEMLNLARAHLPRTSHIEFTTNGTLINKSIAEELVSSGLTCLAFSIDGACKDTFNSIRAGADFDEVLRNIELVNQAKKRINSSTPELCFEFVAMRSNIQELPEVIALAHEYLAKSVIVSNLLPHVEDLKSEILYGSSSDESLKLFIEAEEEAKRRGVNIPAEVRSKFLIPYFYGLFGFPPLRSPPHSDVSYVKSDYGAGNEIYSILYSLADKAIEAGVVINLGKLLNGTNNDLKMTLEIFHEAQVIARKYNIELQLPAVIPRAHRECGFIKGDVCFVTWDGQVRPCSNLSHSYPCFLYERPKNITSVTFGNVLETSLDEIWNSIDYRKFRTAVEAFDLAPCGDCGYADGCGLLSSQTKPIFENDCYMRKLPCGDCPWARGILSCLGV